MSDENFDRTIVFLIDHGSHGAVGVVINRPGEAAVQPHFPKWWDLAAVPSVVFEGGPVRPTAAICVGLGPNVDIVDPDSADAPVGFQPIVGRLGVVDLRRTAEETGVTRLRIFAGYAGWSPGQLEGELEVGGWFVVPAEVSDLLGGEPELLWHNVLKRQSDPSLAALASFPPDPRLN